MSASERRITPASAALATLGLLAAAVGWWAWPQPETTAAATRVKDQGVAALVETRAVPNAPQMELTQKIRAIIGAAIGEAGSRGAEERACHVSVLVQELGVPGELVEIDADRRVRPASNMKLVTTAVALALLGCSAHFETHLVAEARPVDGVLDGDLVVLAGADPLLGEEVPGGCAALLKPWVSELVAAGVLSVKGDLVLDEGSYADPAPGPEWPSSNQHWSDYCALSGGFTANGGCVSLFVQPTLIGQAARVRLAPEGHGAVVELDVLTVPKGATLDVKAVIGVDRIRVWGVIPMDVREWSARQAHPDPVALFGSVLKRALMIGGVEVQGEVRRERLASGGHVLATLRTPILSVLAPINTHSDNAVADQLFLMVGAAVGGGGDRAGGGEATRGALTALGLDADGIQQVDGSGLSRANRVSARHMVALLDTVIAADDAGSAAFIESLALAARTGTLADRMQGGAAALRVRAKSGFIGGTSGLSGVAMTEGGCLLVFSIFVDYPVLGGLNRGVWKPMQDAICEALVQSDGP